MLTSGSTFGKYTLQRELGSGPSGIVYLALDTRLDRLVAFKFLHIDLCRNAAFHSRFTAHVRRAGLLSHPNVAMMYDMLEYEGSTVLISEYLEMENITALIRRRGLLPPEAALPLFSQLASAVSSAHAHGIIHGGLKPSNVFIDNQGVVKITDFGVSGPECVNHSKHLEVFAPEILQGNIADEKTDVYGLGFVLYVMLTAGLPYLSADQSTLLERMREEAIPKPRSVYPDISISLEGAVLRALQADRQKRFSAASAFLKDVEAGVADNSKPIDSLLTPISEKTPPVAQKPVPQSGTTGESVIPTVSRKRNPLRIVGIVAVLCVVIFAATFVWNKSNEKKAQQEFLRRQAELEQDARQQEDRFKREQQERAAAVERTRNAQSKAIVDTTQTQVSETSSEVAETEISDSTGDEVSDSEIYPVEIDHKIGYVNSAGSIVIQPTYDASKRIDDYEFKEGLARVKLNGKLGFINQSGQIVIPTQFDDAFPVSEGLACVKVDDKWGYVDKGGNWVIRPRFKTASQYRDGLFAVREGDKVGFMNVKQEVVIPAKYETVGSFYDGLAAVKLGGKRGFIDKRGQMIIGLNFDEAYHFNEGLAPVVSDKWGYIDRQGRMVIQPQYAEAYPFYSDYAVVRFDKEGPAGYINKSGVLTIPARFTWAAHFMGDRAWVWQGDKCGYINKSGQFIWNPR